MDYEYHKHMVETPVEMITIADAAISKLSFDTFKDTFNAIFAGGKRHPLPSDCIDDYSQELKSAIGNIKDKVTKLREHYWQLFKHQNHQFVLSELLEDHLLPGFTEAELVNIYKEGEDRYNKRIPPGYMDNDKDDNEYGDLIIWKEIIGLAKETKKNIFFISYDIKEDWIYRINGKTWGPRIELIREFRNETNGLLFHIYTLDQFLENIGTGFEKEELEVIGEQSVQHHAKAYLTIRRAGDKPKIIDLSSYESNGKHKNDDFIEENDTD